MQKHVLVKTGSIVQEAEIKSELCVNVSSLQSDIMGNQVNTE